MTGPRLDGLPLGRGLYRDLYPSRDLCPDLPRLDLPEVPGVRLGRLLGWRSTRRL